ncbi:MAG: PEGA domain-containing protein [Deltaproteobacteria bacterium]|nr:PEGA domain-containing protein [Deltaproteobacteria bacterium]
MRDINQVIVAVVVEVRDAAAAKDQPLDVERDGLEPPVGGWGLELGDALEPRLPLVELEVSPAETAQSAVVKVDGVALPVVGPQTVLRLDAGAHIVTVEAPGFERAAGAVAVRERERRRVSASLAQSFALGDVPVATLVSGGLAIAGLLVGGVTGVMSMVETESLLARCEAGVCPPTSRPRYERTLDLARASNVGFAVAAAGAAAALLTLGTRKERPNSRLRLDVGVTGLRVSGSC